MATIPEQIAIAVRNRDFELMLGLALTAPLLATIRRWNCVDLSELDILFGAWPSCSENMNGCGQGALKGSGYWQCGGCGSNAIPGLLSLQ